MDNKNIYIRNLESAEIYEHIIRNKEIPKEYSGMIAYSLELIKLKKEGLKERKTKTEKLITDDIINIKFNKKVKSGEDIVKKLENSILILEKKINQIDKEINSLKKKRDIEKKKEKINQIDKNIKKKKMKINEIDKELNSSKWQEVEVKDLRKYFYLNKFSILLKDSKGNIKKNTYKIYKRSSAKSRTGQVLAIKEELYNEMIDWSRMNIDFANKKIDYAGLLAYESLVSSSIIDTIKINPNNILIVDDVKSKFNQECNVIRKNKFNKLDSFKENCEIKNEIFDGESLLDTKFFNNNKGMMLLRNHFFKSCAFNTNIQSFLRDNCPSNLLYSNWKLVNMFGEEIMAKDVEMIICPTSLKALKFSEYVSDKETKLKQQKEMFNYWKNKVRKDKNIFGICKNEKESKRGLDNNGNVLQQTSYQMLNSINFTHKEIEKITDLEKKYIDNLKNNDDEYIKFLEENKNEINCNEMFVKLYNANKDIVNTKVFREFRSKDINKYSKHCKVGKIRLNGDYCVLFGNPIELLYHAIGKLPVKDGIIDKQWINNKQTLKNNEIYTTLHKFNKEYVAFRNPHTSPANVLLSYNVKNKYIEKYFNLTKNIVCVNAINFAIQDILSSADYDSDTMLIFNNKILLDVVKDRIYNKYKVCVNDVKSEKNKCEISQNNMYLIDNTLCKSQAQIGQIVNLGQQIMSIFWDKKSINKLDMELYKKIDVMTVLSCIAIDLAKKMYNIDIDKEIKEVKKINELKNKKPIFFKHISKNKSINKKIIKHNCSMDFLQEEFNKLEYANSRKNINFIDLLVEKKIKEGRRDQEANIIEYVEEMVEKINYINSNSFNTKEEKFNKIEDVIKYYNFKMNKLKVKETTMFAMLFHIFGKNKQNNSIKLKLLTILYKTQREVFINAFKKKTK